MRFFFRFFFLIAGIFPLYADVKNTKEVIDTLLASEKEMGRKRDEEIQHFQLLLHFRWKALLLVYILKNLLSRILKNQKATILL